MDKYYYIPIIYQSILMTKLTIFGLGNLVDLIDQNQKSRNGQSSNQNHFNVVPIILLILGLIFAMIGAIMMNLNLDDILRLSGFSLLFVGASLIMIGIIKEGQD